MLLRLRRLIATGLLLACVSFGSSGPEVERAAAAQAVPSALLSAPMSVPPTEVLRQTSFMLDGVSVRVATPFLPAPSFTVAQPGNASQMATSATRWPLREFSIIAVPFGHAARNRGAAGRASWRASGYAAALRAARGQQGGQVVAGPATQRDVVFFPGVIGEEEWQCVELVTRYLFLVFGIPPYFANGEDVVDTVYRNEPNLFTRTLNNRPGSAGPLPQIRDVLSYGPTPSGGHTSIVVDSEVKPDGWGSVTVIEENGSSAGIAQLRGQQWFVNGGDGGTVEAWLHPRSSSYDGVGNCAGTILSDINCDQVVDIGDLSRFATDWGNKDYGSGGLQLVNPRADMNRNGIVDLTDCSIFARDYGWSFGASPSARRSPVAPGAASMVVSPAGGLIRVGSTFTVNVQVNATAAFNAAQAAITASSNLAV